MIYRSLHKLFTYLIGQYFVFISLSLSHFLSLSSPYILNRFVQAIVNYGIILRFYRCISVLQMIVKTEEKEVKTRKINKKLFFCLWKLTIHKVRLPNSPTAKSNVTQSLCVCAQETWKVNERWKKIQAIRTAARTWWLSLAGKLLIWFTVKQISPTERKRDRHSRNQFSVCVTRIHAVLIHQMSWNFCATNPDQYHSKFIEFVYSTQ